MPRINHLTIRRFGNVVPDTELRFDPRGAVLLGRNGTGKTTLLELLAAIGRGDPSQATADDYDVEFSMSCAGAIELNVQARRERAEARRVASSAPNATQDDVLAPFLEPTHHQSIRIEALDNKSGERTLLESSDRTTTCTFPDGTQATLPIPAERGWHVLVLGLIQNEAPGSLSPAYIELLPGTHNTVRFDEGLDYFRMLTERESGIEASFTKDGTVWFGPYGTRLISRDCADLLVKDFKRNEEHATTGFGDSSQIEYLKLFAQLAGFERARIGAELDRKQHTGRTDRYSFRPFRFSLERNGSVLHHDHLSFGQRRLLAFLHYHDSTPSLVIADELVNGMHYEWISACLERMRGSQAFLSSQNPLLFDFMTFESAEEVATRFIICDLDDQHRFVWRNMNEADATEFYETHRAGLQHASEILRTRGYW